ncbi:MAG TPA: carboxypeptidase regulatory-like domain-containing protein [Pyrinomonadaceae bacterium]|nr:carboxypeptidase regulatory-like domain-containing protein [Pyrinomonadaceae bacterium]
MSRTPEVCPSDFCPQFDKANDGDTLITTSQRPPGLLSLIRFTIGIVAVMLVVAFQASLTPVYCQVGSATLSGTVTDQNDAVVPGVNVVVISISQAFTRAAITNREGVYVVPLLPPGAYTVKAERKGFTTAEVPDVVLNVNDQVTLNIPLKVGSVNQSVDVLTTPPLLDQSPTVATAVDQQTVGNMPLNGRSFQSLITLAPGVVLTKTTVTEQGQFSANGQRTNANYVTVDGVSANIAIIPAGNIGQSSTGSLPGFSVSGGTSNLVSIDAVQEFKILTSTFAPEFGRTPGAQVTIASRSGTNSFSGTLFEYLRNDVLDATDWFVNANPILRKAALRQNNFGGVLGGPLVLPAFGEGTRPLWYDGKNRTFFFFSYEALRLRQPLFGATDVPSRAARQLAPAATKPLLNGYPLPTGPDRVNGLADFLSSYSDPSRLDATSLRMDHVVGSKLNFFGRFNYAPSETAQRGANFSPLNNINTVRIKTLTLTSGATYIASPNVTTDFRFNYSKNEGISFFEIDGLGGAAPPPDSLLFPSPFTSDDSLFFFVTASGGRNPALSSGRSADHVQRQYNLLGNVSILQGGHQFKFGADYRRMKPRWVGRLYGQSINFVGVLGPTGAAAPGTVLSGIAQSASASASESNSAVFENFSAYFQDTWKMSRQLTVTYGLRWDVNPAPKGEKDLISATGLDNPATFALAPLGTPLYETTYGNFAPRIGVAYHLREQSDFATVIRGGWGMFYDLGSGFLGNTFNSFPYIRTRNTTLTPYPLSPAVATPPPFSIDQAFTSTIVVADPHLQLPRTYQWNVTVDQSLGNSQVFSAAYVAAKGRDLLRQERYNAPNPKFQIVDVTRNAATSNYNSLQLQFRRRLTRGLQALVSYTWSESLDNVSSDAAFLTPTDKIDPQIDRGPSDFDIRHQFSTALTYNFPKPGFDRITRELLKDWAIDTIFSGRSAAPVNVVYTRNIGFGNFSFRPDLIEGIPLYIEDPNAPGGRRFNNQVVAIPGNPRPQVGPFRAPVENRQGNLPRNFLRGFPVYQLDLALRRDFRLRERLRLQFRTEVFNIFNHPNFADPNNSPFVGNSANPAFGVSQTMFGRSLGSGGATGGFNPLYQIGGPRSIQFAFKLMF